MLDSANPNDKAGAAGFDGMFKIKNSLRQKSDSQEPLVVDIVV